MTGLFSKDGNFHLAQGTIFESRKRGAAAIFWDQLSIIKLSIPLQQQSFSDFCHIVDGFQAD